MIRFTLKLGSEEWHLFATTNEPAGKRSAAVSRLRILPSQKPLDEDGQGPAGAMCAIKIASLAADPFKFLPSKSRSYSDRHRSYTQSTFYDSFLFRFS